MDVAPSAAIQRARIQPAARYQVARRRGGLQLQSARCDHAAVRLGQYADEAVAGGAGRVKPEPGAAALAATRGRDGKNVAADMALLMRTEAVREREIRAILKKLPADRPGRLLLVPSFAGERTPTWATTARGAVAGLDLDVTPGDLMLAVYEGTALALRECLDILGRHTPSSLTLRCVGGGARSVAWLHVKADVLGRPVEVPASGHGAAVGAGLLAGLAVGHFTTAGDLRSLTAGTRAPYLPDPGRHAAYTTRLELFRQLRDSLPDLDDALVRTGEQEGCP